MNELDFDNTLDFDAVSRYAGQLRFGDGRRVTCSIIHFVLASRQFCVMIRTYVLNAEVGNV